MFGRKKPSEVDILREELAEKIKMIEKQVEANAARGSELASKLEEKAVDLRTQITKDCKATIDEVRTSLETLSLELNNQVLDLSTKVEKNAQNAANWSFAVNEQIEEFRKMYAEVLEDMRKAKDIAIEKEHILTEKYEALVTQLKEKESLALEKESLSNERLKSLQEEVEKREKELEETREKLNKIESEYRQIAEADARAKDLERELKKIKEEYEIQKYELERAQTQIKIMTEENKRSWGTSKALKTYLGESESGRVLSQLMGMDETSIDELASLTGISTYNVNQIVNRFRDIGIVNLEQGTRRVKLNE
jgi:chromosome segregation ATPase